MNNFGAIFFYLGLVLLGASILGGIVFLICNIVSTKKLKDALEQDYGKKSIK